MFPVLAIAADTVFIPFLLGTKHPTTLWMFHNDFSTPLNYFHSI